MVFGTDMRTILYDLKGVVFAFGELQIDPIATQLQARKLIKGTEVDQKLSTTWDPESIADYTAEFLRILKENPVYFSLGNKRELAVKDEDFERIEKVIDAGNMVKLTGEVVRGNRGIQTDSGVSQETRLVYDGP